MSFLPLLKRSGQYYLKHFSTNCKQKMNNSNIKVDVSNKLAVITLCRPEKKNAISNSMYATLTKTLEELSSNENVSITAITGTGDYYCSGTDLTESFNSDFGQASVIKESSERVRKFVDAFINHKKILVAVVNGPAVGIAVTTLALCDIVFSVDHATFHTPFTMLGMSAEGCSSYTFPKIFGPSKANDMLLFNKKMTAQEAFNAGFVSRLYSKEEINSVLWPDLKKNAEELPVKSLIYSKQMMRKFELPQLLEANRQECERLEERWQSEDCINAFMNFFSKRSKI